MFSQKYNKFFFYIVFFFVFLLLIFFLYPVPKTLFNSQKFSNIKIYDRNNILLYELLNESGHHDFISLNKTPKDLQNAFISIEDKRFYKHCGVDILAILRAVWQDVSNKRVVSGASTITQQLLRNLMGTNKKRTVFQKIKESILAVKISTIYSKDKIFEMYLNSIYFGSLSYGIESASWTYFAKSVEHLDLAESAFLAGIPQAPSRYSPINNFTLTKKRQEEVLYSMWKLGYINEDEYNLAVEEKIILHFNYFKKKAPHFVDYLISNLDDKKLDNQDIISSLDYSLQEKINRIIYSDISFLEKFNIHNVAVLLLDAKSSEILTMIGSVNYNDEKIDGAVNVITSLRQVGSTLKPLLYALSFENGWNLNTKILDEEASFQTADSLPYSPKNYDLKYHGLVTVAEALAQSLNVPAVKTLNHIGVNKFMYFLETLGVSTLNQNPSYYGLSLALGSSEFKILELANAYSIFTNSGSFVPTKFLKNFKNKHSKYNILSKESVNQINYILSNNELRSPAFGDVSPLKLSFPVAIKTGTTRNYKDNFTIAYTDDYILAVWVGNSSGAYMHGVSGVSGAGPIAYKILNLLHESTGSKLTIPRKYEVDFNDKNNIKDNFRIISPQNNDVFLIDYSKDLKSQKIQFQSSKDANWYINDELLSEKSDKFLWLPRKGRFTIRAENRLGSDLINIIIK